MILALNNSKKPYSDVRVRRAITHAVDKPEVVKGAMFGFGRSSGRTSTRSTPTSWT